MRKRIAGRVRYYPASAVAQRARIFRYAQRPFSLESEPSVQTQNVKRIFNGIAIAALIIPATIAVFSGASFADDAAPPQAPRLGLIEENDGILSHQDRHYTQGLRVPYLSAALPAGSFWDRSFDFIGQALPMYRGDSNSQRRFEWQVLGQSEFTPTDIHLTPPDPSDRPYAAWLYTGFDWLQENDAHSLHNLEVQLGVVGPAALGEQLQNGYHALVGFRKASGWSYQLRNRPALQFSYDFHRRFELPLGDGFGVDAIPEAGTSMGTVMRYVDVGALLRIGNALKVDYGPERIRPALSGTAYFDDSRFGRGPFHFYFFAGAQGRRVFYNRFIDGAEELGDTLGRKQEVLDLVTGVSLFFPGHVRGDFSAIKRSDEYSGQPNNDLFGSAEISFRF